MITIDKCFKIHKAASDDFLRSRLQNVYVTKRHAIACDGHILAIVPVDYSETEGEHLPSVVTPDAVKAQQKCKREGMIVNGKVELPEAKQTFALPDEEGRDFPLKEVTEFMNISGRNKGQKFGINAKLLKNLADALGNDELILTLPEGPVCKAILVTAKRTNARGLIMPVRVNP